MKVDEIRDFLRPFVNKTIDAPTDVSKFRALLDAHPYWKSHYIAKYRVRLSRLNHSVQLQVRPKIRWVTVSWHACADGHEKLQPPCALSGAMRQAIYKQIVEWKRLQKTKVCVVCQATRLLQVDHDPQPFVILKEMFLRACKLAPPTQFRYDRRTHGPALHSGLFMKEWQQFHQLHASYQFLCRSCNAKKGCRVVTLNPLNALQNNFNLTPSGPCTPTLLNSALRQNIGP
jgi:hypothetical protein